MENEPGVPGYIVKQSVWQCKRLKQTCDFSERILWAKRHRGVVRPGQNRCVKHTMANCFVSDLY